MDEQYTTTTPMADAGFSDINKAAEMLSLLKIDSANLKTVDSLKLREIAEFIESYEDGLFIAENVLRKRQNSDISPVDHLTGYIRLRKQLMSLNKQTEALKEELSFYE